MNRKIAVLGTGAVIEENAKHDVGSQANKAIVEITRRIQAAELKIGGSNLDLANEMSGAR